MAKAREIPGLSRELAYGEVAARVLEVRTAELIDHAAGVLDVTDIERVHDMRVATRRLRAALEVFRPCFPPGASKGALKEVKKIADALGERRDRDVGIDGLTRFAASMPAPDRPGIGSLIERLREEQRQANVELAPYVDAGRLEALRRRLDELGDAARTSVAGVEPALGRRPTPEEESREGT